VPEAARLTRVPAPRIRHWVFGKGGQAALHPELPAQDGQEAIGFLNLIEVVFLRDLRAQGVSFGAIRRAAELAQQYLKRPHPFANGQFFVHTDGKNLLLQVVNETGDKSLVDLASGNGAWLQVLERSFTRSIRFEGSEGNASQWQPDASASRVVIDPQRKFGRPIDNETGVPTDILADALRAENGNAARVAKWWDVPIEAVEQAAEFEIRLGLRRAA
jgi:uncharacterized protein (DUF433 family)